MKIGSVFSGGGGGDLGLLKAGHTLAFACEIDPKARAVLRYHHPQTAIYKDVREITYERLKRDNTPIPDIIVGGSPCQDLSIAGDRTGMDGEQSALFFEQYRIADELDIAWTLWENVTGAFSSNNGADFAAVLETVTGYAPTIPDGGWCNTGVCIGPKRSAVWRVLDSKHFGVPQQRKRIFLVSGPRTLARRVAEVLCDTEGSSRSSATQRTPAERVPACDLGDHAADSTTVHTYAAVEVATTLPRHYAKGLGRETMGAGLVALLRQGSQTSLRRLTPVECERLMGWPDEYTAKGIDDNGNQISIADTQRYRICGNGIVANVTEWIGKRLPTTEEQ